MATSSGEQRVTDEQLTEWDELASLATPSPWHGEHGEYGCVRIGDFGWVCSGPNVPEYDVDSDQGKADAEFIAHAREAVPALIADLRASRAREAELAAEVETWQGRCSADQDNMTRFRRRAVAAEAERDVLQQRIDKAPAIPGVPGHRPEPVTVGNGQDKGQESVLTFERAVQDAAAEAMGGTDNGEEMVASVGRYRGRPAGTRHRPC